MIVNLRILFVCLLVIILPGTLCQPPDPNNLCHQCRDRRNHKDHYADPSDCHYFYQCLFYNETSALGLRQPCPNGTFWRDEVLQCLPEGETPCQDRCQALNQGQCYSKNCREFYVCSASTSYPLCCPDGTTFDEVSCSCVNLEDGQSCTEICSTMPQTPTTLQPSTQLSDTDCRDSFGSLLRTDPDSNDFFLSINAEGETTRMSCAPGTHFDLSACRCDIFIVDYEPPISQATSQCHLWLPFDGTTTDKSMNSFTTYAYGNAELDEANSAVGSGSLRISEGRLEIPGLKNLDLQFEGTFCLFFQCETPGQCQGGLLSNNNEAEKTDFSVILAASNGQSVVGQVRTKRPVETAEVSSSLPGDWNQLCVVYNRTKVQLYQNGNLVNETSANGAQLAIGHCPFTVGTDQSFGDFRGRIDEVLICPSAFSAEDVSAHYQGNREYLIAKGFLPQQTSVRSYSGDKVYSCTLKTEQQMNLMERLDHEADFGNDLHIWKHGSLNRPAEIHIAARSEKRFLSVMSQAKIECSLTLGNLQTLIESSTVNDPMGSALLRSDIAKRTSLVDRGSPKIVGTFATYTDMIRWGQRICLSYRQVAKCGYYGESYERRKLFFMQIGTAPVVANSKNLIFLESNIHAREWITSASVVYVINKLVNGWLNNDADVRQLLAEKLFIFALVANPDGYEYSRTTDRMWRKTRSIISNSKCVGTDPNRNFDVSWGLTGSSSNPCTETYKGTSAFSEPETRAIRDFVSHKSRKASILAFFSVHAYSQMWFVPYGDFPKPAKKPADYNELFRVAQIGADALMAVNKQSWQVGNAADLLYACSGAASDWAKRIGGITYAYDFELRPADVPGFCPPPTDIIPSGEELYAGLIAAVKAMVS